MKEPTRPAPAPVASGLYDREYFLTQCDGYQGFASGQLSVRLEEALARVEIRPGMRVLDIGCGRGEIVHRSWLRGALAWGIDYAAAAIEIARETLAPQVPDGRAAVARADAKKLPYRDGAFDLAFMLDIVEHLHPAELDEALREAHRVLAPGGILFVHTAPNLWYYRFGYPPFRLLRRLQGHTLPRNPKDRFPSHHQVHVNEQSVLSLRRALHAAGFSSRLWVDQSQDRLTASDKPYVRGLAHFVTHNFLLKWIFCGDIYAIAVRGDVRG